MGAKYTTLATSGYNGSPPSDAGAQAAENLISWSGIKTKLGDPVKTLADAINTALVSAFDYSVRQITANDSTVAGDHMRCVEIRNDVSTAITISLGDATTMTNLYRVFIKNSSLISQTLGRVTSGDTIDGVTGNITLPPRSAVIVQTNAAANGYLTVGATGYAPLGTTLPRSYLAGLTLSTAGASATMTVAAGQAMDSTNVAVMNLASSIGKTTSSWAVGTGNGGLDTGAIANATWYHFYEIMRSDTGVVDVLFSLSASAPTMPASYTFKRRIGSGLTNGSAQWTAFIQDGDLFQWTTLVADISSNNPGTASVSRTLTVPTGVNVQAMIQAGIFTSDVANQSLAYFRDLATTDSAPTTALTDGPNAQNGAGGVATSMTRLLVRTNTSAQIGSRISFSSVNFSVQINTLGWIDRRGRDS